MKPSILLRTAAALLLMLAGAANLAGAQTTPNQRDLYTKIEYMIPMRDGVKLYTAVYVPKGKPGRHPILMERTPYGAGPYGPDAYRRHRGSQKFKDAGYIFAYQDVRGRGHSEGDFVNDRPQLIVHLKPNDIDESTDTYDTVDYLVKHVPDNNGRVGIWGISYPGFYAAAGAVCGHPALRAASPQAPVSDWFVGDDFHHHGALFLMDAAGFARFGETEPAPGASAPMRLSTSGDPVRFFLDNEPLSNITAKYFPDTDGIWRYLMEHGTYDEYWQARSMPHNMKDVKCAVMTVGGLFDAEDLWGALHIYKATEAQNRGISNTLVMGPWYHGMWAGPVGRTFGDMDWGQPTSTYFQDEVEFPFFDACLRGDGHPKQPEALLFETGANRWRRFAHWPPRDLKETSFYLEPDKALSTQPPSRGSNVDADSYVSDPWNPVPYQGGVIHNRTREYMLDDQRFATARPDVLSYTSAPMGHDLTIAGPVTADLFVSTTGSDGDFVVKVIDEFPPDAPGKLAGYQMLVRADVMRAKYRNSYENPQPLTPGAVERVTFALPDVLHTFKPGHRMMVQVQSSWFPLVDLNPQRFVDIYHCGRDAFQKATIQVYHSSSYPSRVRVGVLPP